jgi:hypothetical protein
LASIESAAEIPCLLSNDVEAHQVVERALQTVDGTNLAANRQAPPAATDVLKKKSQFRIFREARSGKKSHF